VRTAQALAQAYQSKLLLLHVIPERVYPLMIEDPGIPELEKRLRERHLRSRAGGGGEVDVVVDKGSAAAVICDAATSHSADLIVMGARSTTAAADSGLGATADRVVRKAPMPVWIARPGMPEAPREILCAVDSSDASKRALRNAHHLCRRFRANLTVLHVVEPLHTVYSGMVMLGDGVERGFVTPQKLKFEKFISGLDFRDSSWTTKVRHGKPHEQILAEVCEAGIDLLVMGTIGKSSIARFLIGSVTEKVTRKLSCSLLTMKAQDMIRLRFDADLDTVDGSMCRGKELLDDGFANEAMREFDRCLIVSPTLAAAWDGKAKAYEQLGDASGADQARENARRIRERLSSKIPED
jgi:nucleotide-binding universal stress UspA family protein